MRTHSKLASYLTDAILKSHYRWFSISLEHHFMMPQCIQKSAHLRDQVLGRLSTLAGCRNCSSLCLSKQARTISPASSRKGEIHAHMRHSPDSRGPLRMLVSPSAKTDTNWARALMRQMRCRMLRNLVRCRFCNSWNLHNLSLLWLALQSKLSALMQTHLLVALTSRPNSSFFPPDMPSPQALQASLKTFTVDSTVNTTSSIFTSATTGCPGTVSCCANSLSSKGGIWCCSSTGRLFCSPLLPASSKPTFFSLMAAHYLADRMR